MRLENQVKEKAIAVFKYSEFFSVEPSKVWQKPFSVVLAGCKLAVICNRTAEASRERYIQEQPQYSQQGFQHNARGDPERITEQAIIPLRGLADNPRAASTLQDVINRFK
jgi:hypothetical protein